MVFQVDRRRLEQADGEVGKDNRAGERTPESTARLKNASAGGASSSRAPPGRNTTPTIDWNRPGSIVEYRDRSPTTRPFPFERSMMIWKRPFGSTRSGRETVGCPS
jgi:hypothetical protein